MSLQYIIDGYNVIKHPCFKSEGKSKDPRSALLEVIRFNKLCGSRKNSVLVVLDGFPDVSKIYGAGDNLEVVFSREQSADEKIKKLIETNGNAKTCVVVSDDKEIRFCIRASGATAMGVEEFLGVEKNNRTARKKKEDPLKSDLNYSEMDKINKELARLWLK